MICISKRVSKIWEISSCEFEKIVKENLCIRDIVGALGYIKTSGSMAKMVKRRIEIEKIDTSHLVGRNAKGSNNQRYALEEILVDNSNYANIGRLKKRLINEGYLEYKCTECGNDGMWNNKPLSLQLDHKNGKPNDHRIENLRFLCPNCHAQTDTYSGKNTRNNNG